MLVKVFKYLLLKYLMHKYLLLSRVLEVGVVEVHEAVLEPSDPHLENLLILNFIRNCTQNYKGTLPSQRNLTLFSLFMFFLPGLMWSSQSSFGAVGPGMISAFFYLYICPGQGGARGRVWRGTFALPAPLMSHVPYHNLSFRSHYV